MNNTLGAVLSVATAAFCFVVSLEIYSESDPSPSLMILVLAIGMLGLAAKFVDDERCK